MAFSLFWVCERSFWLWTTMPVGPWVRRTARVGLVDVLAAGALGAVRVDPDLVPVELDLDVVVDLGQDLDERERRLAPLLGVERADAHEAMDAALGAQPAVGAPALDLDGDALEPGLLALLLVDDLGREAMALGPAQVHPQEHLGPVGRLGAAGAGADRQDRGALVVLAGEQERGPLAVEVGLERRRHRGRARPRARHRRSRRGARRRPRGRRRGSAGRATVSISERRPSASRRTFWAPRWSSQNPGSWVSVVELGDALLPWPRGQRRPEVDRIRSARSRMADAST